MGLAGVINVGGIRIGGLSGIYKSNDYMRGRYEKQPYTDQTKRSIYHIRQLEVFRLKQVNINFFKFKLDMFQNSSNKYFYLMFDLTFIATTTN